MKSRIRDFMSYRLVLLASIAIVGLILIGSSQVYGKDLVEIQLSDGTKISVKITDRKVVTDAALASAKRMSGKINVTGCSPSVKPFFQNFATKFLFKNDQAFEADSPLMGKGFSAFTMLYDSDGNATWFAGNADINQPGIVLIGLGANRGHLAKKNKSTGQWQLDPTQF